MQAFVDAIIKNLLAFWPVARVREYEVAILIRAGRIRREVTTGLHWRIPFIDELKTWPGNEVAVDLGTGSITTADGQAITVSANLSYQSTSLSKMYRALWHTEFSLKLLALGHITSECSKLEWRRLQSDRGAVQAELLDSLNGLARGGEWGVVIKRLNFTDCIGTRAHRHYFDGELPR